MTSVWVSCFPRELLHLVGACGDHLFREAGVWVSLASPVGSLVLQVLGGLFRMLVLARGRPRFAGVRVVALRCLWVLSGGFIA